MREGDVKTAWKVLRVLGHWMKVQGFDYKNEQDVYREIKKQMDEIPTFETKEYHLHPIHPTHPIQQSLMRLAPWPMYRVNNLVRRSLPLQQTIPAEIASITVNSATAAAMNFAAGEMIMAVQGDSRVRLPLRMNDLLPDNTVLLPSGLVETAGFGQAEAAITLEKL